MAVKPGWEGRFFEDFEVGDVYRCRLGRTVTEADNIWFTLLTKIEAAMGHHQGSHPGYSARRQSGDRLFAQRDGLEESPRAEAGSVSHRQR